MAWSQVANISGSGGVPSPLLSATVKSNTDIDTKTYTIVGGSITTITGTSVASVTLAIGDKILVDNAPASTGVANGYVTSQPANGLYVVTDNTTNLTVERAPEMSGTNYPMGKIVHIERGVQGAGSTYAGALLAVTSPNGTSFTYGTTPIQFAGEFLDKAVAADVINYYIGEERSAAATYTNKTIDGANNTLSIPVSAVSATGTADSSTYLRGDGTWATPAGGGDSGMVLDEDGFYVPSGDGSPVSWGAISDKPAVVTGSVNGTATALTLWTGTAAQYAAIGTKDANTVYCVTA